MLKWLLRLVALVIVLAVALIYYGGTVPEHHVSAVSAHYSQPPEAVWAVLTDVMRFPEWRDDLDKVELLPEVDGHRRWREEGDYGTLNLEVTESAPPRHMTTTILYAAAEEPDFSGSWIFDLEPDGGGTRLTLTEDGRVYNRIFRGLAATVMGYQSTQVGYLKALGKRLGEDVEPQKGAVTVGE